MTAVAKTGSRIRRTRADKVFDILNYVILTFCFLIVAYPLYFIVIASISDPVDVYAGKVFLYPVNASLDGYRRIVEYKSFFTGYRNTAVYTIVGTLVNVVMTIPAAYALSRKDLVGRNAVMMMITFTMLFSGGMIPSYLVMRGIGLTDNPLGPILLPAINVYNLVLMRNFFEGIPKSLFESADLDGCTPMGAFFRIALPLSKAALASIGLMFAVAYWNDYTNFKLYITDRNLYNFQMKLRDMIASSDLPEVAGGATENTIRNACIITAILPFMILYPFLQKYFVKGINIGAVKE